MDRETQSKFKVQAFNYNDAQYLYEVNSKAGNATIKIFNNEGKLRSCQRISLPANCKIYPCQHYLLAVTSNQIQLFQILTSTPSSTSPNKLSGVPALITYNKKTNLIFILTEKNELFYIMPQSESHKIKSIFKCSQNNISGNITQLMVDNDGFVYLLEISKKIVHVLKFDWADRDKLVEKEEKGGIVGMFCDGVRAQVWIQEMEGDDEHCQLTIKTGEEVYGYSVKKYPENQKPIIKSIKHDILYLDLHSRTLVLIHNKQAMYKQQLDLNELPKRHASNHLIFNTKKTAYNTITVGLNFYQGLPETFHHVHIPLKWLEMNQQREDGLLMYIHNNIHLILMDNGLQPHFATKVSDYLGIKDDHNANFEDLSWQLLYNLFSASPSTIVKLANSLKNSCRLKGNCDFLTIYVKYIFIALEKVTQRILILKQMNQQIEICVEQYKNIRGITQSIINFCSILFSVTKQVQLYPSQYYQNMPNQQQKLLCLKLYSLAERGKCVYIMNQIIFLHAKFIQESANSSNKSIMEQQPKDNKLSKANEIKVSFYVKVGQNTCHQLFDEKFGEQLSIQQILQYVSKCWNFHICAYLFAYYLISIEGRRGEILQIPYIADKQTTQLLRFLILNSNSALKDRQRQKDVLRNISARTSQALLLNQPYFLQHLCSLSINTNQLSCCLCIISSQALKIRTDDDLQFMLECLILCNRSSLAFQEMSEYCKKLSKEQSINYEEYEKMLVDLYIKHRKIKELLLLQNQNNISIDIKGKFISQFGEAAKQIIETMDNLQKD